jgi:hypothetical protein
MLGQGPGAELGGHLLARLGPRVDHGDQLAAGGLGIFLRVKASEIPHSDHCGSYFLHRNGIMPAPMSSPPPIKAPARPFARPVSPTEDEGEPPRLPPWVRRELILYGAALLLGLIGVPLLIWVGGNRVLGPYTHGQNLHAGPLALLQDFYLGLLHGSAVFWVVALGPAALLLLLRLFIRLIRRMPSRDEDEEPEAAPARRPR